MTTRKFALGAGLALVISLAVLVAGCSREDGPSAIVAPNVSPDTRLTGQGPEPLAGKVRAGGDPLAVDRTPEVINITPWTILPSIAVDWPLHWHDYLDARTAPHTFTVEFTGTDPDADSGIPIGYRYLFKPALIEGGPHGQYIRTAYEFYLNVEEVASFSDPAWSDWVRYTTDPADRQITLSNLPQYDEQDRLVYYLLVIQALDESGQPSLEREYAQNAHNFWITYSQSPELCVYEPILGVECCTGIYTQIQHQIAPEQPLNFTWEGNGDFYGGEIAAYRYGWDLVDPDDENDPGWAVQPGLGPEHMTAPEQSFPLGSHTFTVQCWDHVGGLTRIVYLLDVVPVQ